MESMVLIDGVCSYGSAPLLSEAITIPAALPPSSYNILSSFEVAFVLTLPLTLHDVVTAASTHLLNLSAIQNVSGLSR